MKNLKKSLLTISCAAVMASMAVTANAYDVKSPTGLPAAAVPGGALSGIVGQIGSNGGCVNDILGLLQGGKCPLPPQLCPGNQPNESCPGLPGAPGWPDAPSLPDAPVFPEFPTPPEMPGTPDTDQPGTDAPEDGTPGSTAAYANEVVRLVNQERASAGLAPLTVNVNVQSAAQVRAKEQKALFSHTRPNGASCFTALAEAGVPYRSAGENIAYGQRSAQEVMTGWMNSSGHRANILSSAFTEIGVGCYQDASGTLYWAQMFIA